MEFLNIYMCMFDYMCVALACLSYGRLILMELWSFNFDVCVCVCVCMCMCLYVSL